MSFLLRISAWCLILCVLFTNLSWCRAQPTRCVALCLRSETEDSCQRCRLRVPMRFGKRTMDTNNNGRLRIPMRFGKRHQDIGVGQVLEMSPVPVLQSRKETPSSQEGLPNNFQLDNLVENWFMRVLNDPSLADDNNVVIGSTNDYDQN